MTQQWQPSPQPLDRGEADADVRAAMASAYADGDSYARCVAALCTARLILPTEDAPDAEPGLSKLTDAPAHDPGTAEHEHDHPDHAVVLLRSPSGQKAVVVFTGYDALRAWRPGVRPVRCTLDDVAATVHETGSDVILVDVAGPHPVVIESSMIDELAQGHRLIEVEGGGFAWVWDAPDAPAEPV